MNQQATQIPVISLYFRMLDMSFLQPLSSQMFHTCLLRYTAYINNVTPEDGLESPKHVERPKIKTNYRNLCILLVHFHIAV